MQNRTDLVAQYELFASVDEMLSPGALSVSLQRPIRAVQRTPAPEAQASTRNAMEWVTLDGDERPRYLLKHLEPKNDWVMQASLDHRCRGVRLWQYGLLDRLLPWLDHTIVACADEGEAWALLMRDVSAGLFQNAGPWTVSQIHDMLDALARMHATFWEKDELTSPELGLPDLETYLGTMSVPTARRLAHLPEEPFGAILAGWDLIQTRLEPDTLEIFRELMLNPQPLLTALRKYPFTLVHGDYRSGDGEGGNVGLLPGQPPRVFAFDWQLASFNLMTVDLAWFADRTGTIWPTLSPDECAVYYRQRLEHYLGHPFEPGAWQAMLELGFLVDTLRIGWYLALTDALQGYNERIRAGAKWL